MTTLPIFTLVSISLTESGAVDWSACEARIKEQIEKQVDETRLIREGCLAVLNANASTFVEESTLIAQLGKIRERAYRHQQEVLGEEAVDEPYSLQEQSKYAAKVSKFLDDNKTVPADDKKGTPETVGMFLSRRGRAGGLQTYENAKAIAEASKKKLSAR